MLAETQVYFFFALVYQNLLLLVLADLHLGGFINQWGKENNTIRWIKTLQWGG
jgi:hypothetical protein